MNFAEYQEADDLLSDILLDKLYFSIETNKMNSDYRRSRTEFYDMTAALRIIRELNENEGYKLNKAAIDFLTGLLPNKDPKGVEDYFKSPVKPDNKSPFIGSILPNSSETGIDEFYQHVKKYISIYHPDAGYEICQTKRFSENGKNEAAVIATRNWSRNEEIKYCQGLRVEISDEGIFGTERNRDFSIIYSVLNGNYNLLLGPARFINHDCNPNCQFVSLSKNTVTFNVVRQIKAGEEFTVFYGENYFGEQNRDCLCMTCKKASIAKELGVEITQASRRTSIYKSIANPCPQCTGQREEVIFSNGMNDTCDACYRHKLIFGFDWPARNEKFNYHNDFISQIDKLISLDEELIDYSFLSRPGTGKRKRSRPAKENKPIDEENNSAVKNVEKSIPKIPSSLPDRTVTTSTCELVIRNSSPCTTKTPQIHIDNTAEICNTEGYKLDPLIFQFNFEAPNHLVKLCVKHGLTVPVFVKMPNRHFRYRIGGLVVSGKTHLAVIDLLIYWTLKRKPQLSFYVKKILSKPWNESMIIFSIKTSLKNIYLFHPFVEPFISCFKNIPSFMELPSVRSALWCIETGDYLDPSFSYSLDGNLMCGLAFRYKLPREAMPPEETFRKLAPESSKFKFLDLNRNDYETKDLKKGDNCFILDSYNIKHSCSVFDIIKDYVYIQYNFYQKFHKTKIFPFHARFNMQLIEQVIANVPNLDKLASEDISNQIEAFFNNKH